VSLRNELEKLIDKKRQEIDGHHQAVALAETYIMAIQDVLRKLPKDGLPESALRPGSDLDKARELIRKAGKPVHISDLLKGLGREMTNKTRANLTGSIGNYARQGKIFKKVSPNTFTLIELENKIFLPTSNRMVEDFIKAANLTQEEEEREET